MRGALIGMLLVFVASVLVSCGGDSKTPTNPSKIKNRVLVSNAFSGVIEIVDGDTDALGFSTIFSGAGASLMVLSSDKSRTLVLNSTANSVSLIDSATESVVASVTLPGSASSIALSPDGKTGYAALPDLVVTGEAKTGAVEVLDLAASAISKTIAAPLASELVLSHNGGTLLVFADHSNALSNTVQVIDTSTGTPTAVSVFDRAASAVFSSDDSTAFILNCGPECGGGVASVQALTIASGTAGTPVAVPAATTAFLNGSTLFVAGTPSGMLGAGAGRLTLVSLSGNTLGSAGAPLQIGDGFHTLMALTPSNKLYIGASNCTNDPNSATPTGCLSIFDTSANTAVIDSARDPNTGSPKGFVTGIQPLPNRSIVYVAEGGRLRVFDSTNNQEVFKNVGITGRVVDVKALY